MRAMAWQSKGKNQLPQLMELEPPVPGRGQVRVRVVSSAANPADVRVVNGDPVGRFLLHANVSPLVVGYDFSGTVEHLGDGVDDLKVGDEVFGFLPYSTSTRQGAFAELITADRSAIARKPPNVSHEIAAAAATPAITALQSLRDLGRLGPSGRVLVMGAAGGVGSLAIGVARRLGAKVTAVCSTYATDFVSGLGAEEVVDRRKRDPRSVPGPFDVVFDAAAAYSYLACQHQLGPRGAYVTTLPSPGLLLGKIATLFSSRRCEFVAAKALRQDFEQIATWLADGLSVPIDTRFPVRDARAALDRISKGEVRGRLSIQVDGGF